METKTQWTPQYILSINTHALPDNTYNPFPIMNPMFSIIVPVYNVERYLNICIESIQNQTFQDFEAILVDDGSTDNSANILDSIHDSRFKVFHKTNGGVSSARNLALENAAGEYIIFCDPDDKLLPDTLKIFKDAIVQYPQADWIRGNNLVSYPDGRTINEGLHNKRAPFAGEELDQTRWFQHIVNAGELWATLFKKEKIQKLQLRFNPKLRNGEDGIWLMDYTMTGNGVYIPDIVYDYLFQRADGLSFSRAKNEADCISIIELAKELQTRINRYPSNSQMHNICQLNFDRRCKNGIGSLTFVPRNIRYKYLRMLKAIFPKIDIRTTSTRREKIKAIMYNYFLWSFLLPTEK